MTDHYQALAEHFQTLAHLEHALTFLQWDHMVIMPPGGSDSRAKAMAELSTLHHKSLTSQKTGDLLDQAKGQRNDPEIEQSLKEMERVYNQAICLPPELVKAQSLAGSKCEHEWRQQRQENDWNGFRKNFDQVVKLSREEAQARYDSRPGQFTNPYDAMLDLHCTGDSSDFIIDVFNTLAKEIPPLLLQIIERQNSQHVAELNGEYPIENQKKLSHALMRTLGFNFDRGRLDVSAHPFSTGCRGDQRITTRFRKNDFFDALLATAHETGHASYENGLLPKWDGLPIGEARNLCLHESQSLFFEKQIFLSKPFIKHFSQSIHNHLPSTHIQSSDMLWKVATRVQPSLIRVEADEVTYPLHIILRFNIESELINGTVEVNDIPDLWDSKMQKYLGISTKGNFKDGCMQDMHWTDGAFGYFPSYTIGALNSAQLSATIRAATPDWQDKLARGDVAFILDWLAENIWSKGSSMESQEMMIAATGEKTNPAFFLNHLKERYVEERY